MIVDVRLNIVVTAGSDTVVAVANPKRVWICLASYDGVNYQVSPFPPAFNPSFTSVPGAGPPLMISCHDYPGLPEREWHSATGGGQIIIIEGILISNQGEL